jgi:hypothetical protein
MVGRVTDSRPQQVTWQSLNKRQQDYLTAIYHADQEVEADERGRWSRGSRPRPAVEWRWMVYATLDGYDTPVKRHLRSTKQISEGTGSTLEALEKRKLINVRYDITTYNGREILTSDPIPTIQITPSGRALVRQALDIRGGKQVVGTLQEWHWRALAKAYTAGEQGVREEGLGYGRIGWNTWLRLRDYQIHRVEYPLIKERNGVSITTFGIAYYERTFARYHELYPDVAAPEPREQHDPLEPFVEVLQDHRTCRACGGEHLVMVTRSFRQDQKWAWSVEELASRIPGRVTSKYGEVEQCLCQEEEIQEMSASFLALLDRLAQEGWQVSFPHHYWIDYLDYLVGGVSLRRERRWYDPELVKAKVLPLLDDTEMDDARNVMKGDMRYCWNEPVGKGSIYPQGLSGGLNMRPVANTCARETNR